MQTFLPRTALYFGDGALDALKGFGAKRVLLVTDPFFAKSGEAERLKALCGCECRIFDGVRPDPDLTQIAQGIAAAREFSPDLVVALGGGSAVDCAKGIVCLGKLAARLVAIPTTSGSGSEVTSFAVVTHEGVKYPLIDAQLRPEAAILDASLLKALPPKLIADAGTDVLSHCLEAVAAKNASPFTDAYAIYAFRTVLELLPRSYRGEIGVREKIHCAATMAGLAFDSAGLGACHALSHALGGRFHISHGRLNGILMPHVVAFNADCAQKAYLSLTAACGVSGIHGLLMALRRSRAQLSLPGSLSEAGLKRDEVLSAADAIAEAAAADACAQSNPRPVGPADFLALLKSAL